MISEEGDAERKKRKEEREKVEQKESEEERLLREKIIKYGENIRQTSNEDLVRLFKSGF